MTTFDRYWLTNLTRGLLAVAAGIGINLLPHLLSSVITKILFFPLIVGISLVFLSLYGVLDSLLVIFEGTTLPRRRPAHWALLTQGLVGASVLLVAIALPLREPHLRIFAVFAATQALSTAIADASAAIAERGQHHGMFSLLICASISLFSGVSLLFAGSFTEWDLAFVIFFYLLLHGSTLTFLSLRMLYMHNPKSQKPYIVSDKDGPHVVA